MFQSLYLHLIITEQMHATRRKNSSKLFFKSNIKMFFEIVFTTRQQTCHENKAFYIRQSYNNKIL